ncbi:MAG: hypothetical protein AB3N22_21415 [Ruegeria sp.]
MQFPNLFPTNRTGQLLYVANFGRSEVAKFVYQHLDKIDTKASSQLRFNAIAIVVLGYFFFQNNDTAHSLSVLYVVVSFLFFIAVGLLMSVSWLFWYDSATINEIVEIEKANKEGNEYKETAELISGFQRLNSRTKRFAWACGVSFLASFGLAFAITCELFSRM